MARRPVKPVPMPIMTRLSPTSETSVAMAEAVTMGWRSDGIMTPGPRLPDLTSTYAGYVAWRGTLDEADAPPDLVERSRLA
jgi:hypothetical protein